MASDRYKYLERVYSNDKTIPEMLRDAYDLGVKFGEQEANQKLADELNPFVCNYGVQNMTPAPPQMRVVLLDPKLKVLYERCPEKAQLRITVTSMQNSNYNKQYTLYTTFDVSNDELPEVVREMLINQLKREGQYNWSKF